MANFTHLSSLNVQGSVETSAQGKLIGSFDTMPVASEANVGQIVLYTGPTGTYVQGKYYVSNGSAWTISAASPAAVTVDSALSTTSTNPVQNKVIQSALDGKLGKTETAAKATADADGNAIPTTYLKQTDATSTYLKQTDATSTYLKKTDAANTYATQDALSSAIGSVYRYKNSVTNYSDLPPSGNTVGDVYNVVNAYGNVPAGTNWAWNGSAWDALAGTVDLSPYAKATDVANTYATQTALTNGLAAKQNALTFDSAPTSGSSNPVTSGGVYSAINTGVPASGSYDADTSTITFKAASGAQLFQVTGIEGGGVQFTLKVTYTGAPDVSGISVTATPVTGATATVQGTTNSSGVAYLSVKQNATYRITSSKSGYTFTSTPEVSCTDLTTESSISCYVPGTVTITVTDEKASVVGRTVTATASGQTTQTKTVASGQTSVTFSLPAGTWTFKSDYPSGATGSTSFTQAVANNGTYSGTISIVYIRVFGYILTRSQSNPSKKVSYPETIFGYTNAAASVAKATAVGSPGGWASVQDTLITGIVDETFNGDAMVYVQDSWYKRKEKDSSGNEYVAFASTLPDKEPSKWEDRAGSVDGVRMGHFRIGKYLTSSNNRSVSGSTPQVNTSITNFISYAQNRTYDGHPYDIMTKDQYEYFVDLLPMIFGTTNLQTIMRGYVDGHPAVATSAVLSEDALGMAGSAGDGRMSALHVNDLWGNAYQFVGGARTDGSCNLWVRNGLSAVSDPTTANGWEKACDAVLVNTGGYIDDVAGTNKAGNFPISRGGSSSTHFADRGYVYASDFPYVGGYYDSGDGAGPFYEAFNCSATYTYAYVGSRISYRY